MSDSGTSELMTAYTVHPKYWTYNPASQGEITGITEYIPENNKKGDDDMRYLYEVILVNPKNDVFSEVRIVAKSETSALMKAYNATQFKNKINKTLIGNLEGVDFDDLKTSCRVLMEWKKEYPKTACE